MSLLSQVTPTFKGETMNNTNSTDTSKTANPQTPFEKKGEANVAQPAKVEEPKPNSDTDRQATGDQKQPTDDATGKSLR